MVKTLTDNEKHLISNIVKKSIEKLELSGWKEVLKTFLFNSDFTEIFTKLWDEKRNDFNFTPTISQLFRAFTECSWENLKVVILSDSPYSKIGVSDGLAFSCGNNLKHEKVLKIIQNSIKSTVYPVINHNNDSDLNPDLTSWANQGVLLLNTSLTTRIGENNSHSDIWEEFTTFVLTQINDQKKDIIFISFGEISQQWTQLIDSDKHYVFQLEHPKTAIIKQTKWKCSDVFNKTNNILNDLNKNKIKW